MSFTRDLLTGAVTSGLYRADEIDVDLVAMEAAGWREIWVELRDVAHRDELVDAFTAAFSLPSWFGRNLDGLADCLTDLSWLEASGWLVQLVGPGQARHEAAWWDQLVDVLREAVEFWTEEDTAMVVVARWPELPEPLLQAFSPLG